MFMRFKNKTGKMNIKPGQEVTPWIVVFGVVCIVMMLCSSFIGWVDSKFNKPKNTVKIAPLEKPYVQDPNTTYVEEAPQDDGGIVHPKPNKPWLDRETTVPVPYLYSTSTMTR